MNKISQDKTNNIYCKIKKNKKDYKQLLSVIILLLLAVKKKLQSHFSITHSVSSSQKLLHLLLIKLNNQLLLFGINKKMISIACWKQQFHYSITEIEKTNDRNRKEMQRTTAFLTKATISDKISPKHHSSQSLASKHAQPQTAHHYRINTNSSITSMNDKSQRNSENQSPATSLPLTTTESNK